MLETKIDIESIRKVSEKIKASKREDGQRINLTLGCYLALETDNLNYCSSCENFQSCISYLMAFKRK